MRKGLALLGIILMAFLPLNVIAEEVETVQDIEDTGVALESAGDWEIDEYIDDFGDPTGGKYMKQITEGDFSNTATASSNLAAIVFYEPDDNSFSFRLLEYGDHKATYTNYYGMKIAVKIDDEVYEHYLYGNQPNGDLVLNDFLENKVKLMTEKDLLSDEEVLALVQDVKPEESGALLLYTTLLQGKDIKCVIYVENSKYRFDISGNGFSEMIKPFIYEKAISLMDQGKYNEAGELFDSIEDYSDAKDRKAECEEIITQNEAEYKPIISEVLNSNSSQAIDDLIKAKECARVLTKEDIKSLFSENVYFFFYPLDYGDDYTFDQNYFCFDEKIGKFYNVAGNTQKTFPFSTYKNDGSIVLDGKVGALYYLIKGYYLLSVDDELYLLTQFTETSPGNLDVVNSLKS